MLSKKVFTINLKCLYISNWLNFLVWPLINVTASNLKFCDSEWVGLMHSTDFNRVISFLKKHDQHISSLPSMHCLRGETLLSFVHFIATVVCFKMIMIKNANSEEGWLNSVTCMLREINWEVFCQRTSAWTNWLQQEKLHLLLTVLKLTQDW